jgi:hypothetical protein
MEAAVAGDALPSCDQRVLRAHPSNRAGNVGPMQQPAAFREFCRLAVVDKARNRQKGPAMASRRLQALLAAAAGALLSGCASGVPAPATMAGPTASRGLFEHQIGPDRWEVGFAGAGGPASRGNAAFELVLRRGAELARREGFPAFRVEATRTDVVTEVQNDYGDPSWGPGGPRHWGPVSQAEHWRDYRHLHRSFLVTVPRLVAEIRFIPAAEPGSYVVSELMAGAPSTP